MTAKSNEPLAGHSMLRPGFAWTPEGDAAFALGFPHIRTLVTGGREDEEPHTWARKILSQDFFPRLSWPKKAAYGLVRVWGMPAIWEMNPAQKGLRDNAEEALWSEAPVRAAEAAALLRCRMEKETGGLDDRMVENFVLLLEAMVGSEALANAMVDILESLEPDLFIAEWTLPPMVTYQLGYLLLRCSAPVDAALRERLGVLLKAAYELRPALKKKGFTGLGSSHARSVHLVLHGAVAAEQTDHNLRWYGHVTDKARLVQMRVALTRDLYIPDSRMVFLGGLGVLERHDEERRRLASEEEQRWFFAQHAPIQGSQMLTILLDMAGDSLVKEDVASWLSENARKMGGAIEAMASGAGSRAQMARAVLKRAG